MNDLATIRLKIIDPTLQGRVARLRKAVSTANGARQRAAVASAHNAGLAGTAERLAAAKEEEKAHRSALAAAEKGPIEAAGGAMPELAAIAARFAEDVSEFAALLRGGAENAHHASCAVHPGLQAWSDADAAARMLAVLEKKLRPR